MTLILDRAGANDARRPGSGKSTLAYPLTDRLNTLLGRTTHPSHVDPNTEIASPADEAGTEGEVAICVGLDGWHYSRAELDKFDDPEHAHWRRVSQAQLFQSCTRTHPIWRPRIQYGARGDRGDEVGGRYES